MPAQNWYRLNHYPSEFLEQVYEYYAAHGIAYICTYYHLDIDNSIIDKTVLDSGSYERLGDLSGLVWEKITLLPIYNTEQVQVAFTADERGFGKFDQTTTLNFPSIYGFTPTAKDFIIFDETIINKDNEPSNVPMYQVVNKEKATNSWLTFWKINLQIKSERKDDLELQVRDVYSFVDYEKQIYHIDAATQMYRMLELNSNLIINDSFKENIGYYIGI